jgi:WD40 repeat protein
VWLTAGRDFKLRHWTLSKNSLDPLLQTLQVHSDEITDCVEIVSPQCIATSSLDRTICMLSLENPNQKRIINEKHETGIRHLRYQVTNGA